MALSDYTFSFRDLTFGADGVDANDHGIGVAELNGIDDISVLSGDVRLPRDHGNIPGLHTVNAREVTMKLMVTGVKRSQALADSMSEAFAAFQPTDDFYPFNFKEPGMPERRINLRVIGRARTRNPHTTHGMESVLVRFTASDPRIYSETEHSTGVPIYDPSGSGIDYPEVEYAKDWPALSADAVINNAGDANSYPLLRFYGPAAGTITAVQITNTTTGQITILDSTLLINQILAADMGRIVTASPEDDPYIAIGATSRWGDWNLPRDPFYLAPGDNLLRYEVTGTTTDALLVVTHRDCWL